MVHSVFPIFHFFSFWMWIIFKVYWIYYSVASVLYFEFLALRYIESYRKRLNQSVLKEISPEYSLEGLMLKLQYFGHLMWRSDSLEKTLMLGKTEGRRRREQQRMRWLDGVSSIQFSRSVVSDSLWPQELQHARLPCHSPTPRVHPNPCP